MWNNKTTVLGKTLATIGVFCILHAGYYSIQYEEYVRLSEVKDVTIPPIEAKIEMCIGYLVTLCGVLCMSGTLKPIRATDTMSSKMYDAVNSRPEFYHFNHRGKALYRRVAC